MGLEIQKATPPALFIRSDSNFMINTAVIGEKSYVYFGDLPKSYICGRTHVKNFNMRVNGKPKMWNISKTLDHRAKLNVGTRGTTVHIESTFDARFLEFGLGHSVHFAKISDFTIFKILLISQFSSDFIQLYTIYPNHGAVQAITFLTICQKFKTLWHFDIFS